MVKQICIADKSFAPGSHEVVRLPVTVDLDGGEIALSVHVFTGAKPGPCLLLTGIQHGDEWHELLLFRRLVRELKPADMAGTVVLIPVCSPTALGSLTRVTQVSSDGPDLNRVFPGKHNWIPEQIAKVISQEVLPQVDAIIDFHFGIWGQGIGIVAYGSDFPQADVVQRSREMALAFGYPVVNRGKFATVFPGAGSLTGYAGVKLGIPSIAGEVGLVGYDLKSEEHWTQVNFKGVLGVMRLLGILEGKPERAPRTFIYSLGRRIEPLKGGLLVPVSEEDQLGREVKKGELLGFVISPYTFEVLQRLEAPSDGLLTIASRTCPVRPGEWAFAIADLRDPEGEWVESE
jgi:uncharacterized protein